MISATEGVLGATLLCTKYGELLSVLVSSIRKKTAIVIMSWRQSQTIIGDLLHAREYTHTQTTDITRSERAVRISSEIRARSSEQSCNKIVNGENCSVCENCVSFVQHLSCSSQCTHVPVCCHSYHHHF